MSQVDLNVVRRVLDAYEDLAEKYADEAWKEKDGNPDDAIAWEIHGVAARRIRRAIFEAVGEVDKRALVQDRAEADFLKVLKQTLESGRPR